MCLTLLSDLKARSFALRPDLSAKKRAALSLDDSLTEHDIRFRQFNGALFPLRVVASCLVNKHVLEINEVDGLTTKLNWAHLLWLGFRI